MVREYSVDDMLKVLEDYFTKLGYECVTYPKQLNPVRIPIYCVKKEAVTTGETKEISDEIMVEVTTAQSISTSDFFRTLTIESDTVVGEPVVIDNASSLTFFRHYLPNAKVFLAYPDYILRDKQFDELKKMCHEKSIGLICITRTAKGNTATEDVDVRPKDLATQLTEILSGSTDHQEIERDVASHLQDDLNYLVFYPDPQYRRQEIIERPEGFISLNLIDKLSELKHIKQKNELKKLSQEYRREKRDDYDIALGITKTLWEDYLGASYPEVQKEFEPILIQASEYRDHFVHQFQVYLLGALIIDALFNEKALRQFGETNKSDIEDAWLAAATFHDFNYTIERYEDWTRKFLKETLLLDDGDSNSTPLNLEGPFIRDDFLNPCRELCETLGCDSCDTVIMRFFYERAVKDRNHAALSALTLIRTLDDTCIISKSAVRQAGLAVFLHDEPNWAACRGYPRPRWDKTEVPDWENQFAAEKIVASLEFSTWPLAFLLIYCDTAQEWGRLTRESNDEGYMESLPLLEGFKTKTKGIRVEMSVQSSGAYTKKRDEAGRVKMFLKDKRFELCVRCRDTEESSEIKMTGC